MRRRAGDSGSIWSSPQMQKNVRDYEASTDGLVRWAPRLATTAVGGMFAAPVIAAAAGAAGGAALPAAATQGIAPMSVATGGGMTLQTGLGIGKILTDTFGNLWGARQQTRAADRAAEISSRTALDIANMEREGLDKQLEYLREVDARDYNDWLAREARDRTDWENSERRRAPFRALADSAVRTLADYIRVPGMRPAQDVPVQQWTHQPAPVTTGQAPVNTTMPVRDPRMAGGFVGPQPPARRTLADFARG